MRITNLLSFLVFLLPLQTLAEVYDVSTTAELREALVSAAEAGGDNTIRLAAGTYSTQDDGGGTFEYLSAKDSSLILTADTEDSVSLDGAGIDQVLQVQISDTKVMSLLEVSNFSIENGFSSDKAGGGISIDNQVHKFVARNMVLRNNSSTSGGAFWLGDDLRRAREIYDSVFENNSAAGDGGAIATDCAWVINSTFKGNEGARGGAVALRDGPCNSNQKIDSNNFSTNLAQSEGGAIWFYSCNLFRDSVTDNLFIENSADTHGAVRFACSAERNTFLGNYASGVFSVGRIWNLSNNLFFNNLQGLDGPAVEITTPHPANNNLFYGTSISIGSTTQLTNNIFAENQIDIYPPQDANFFVINNNYLDVNKLDSKILIDGENNIFEGVSLGFVNAEEGDYRLTASSGLIDAGTTDPELAYITDYDYTGTTDRVIGSSIDIGPYEYDGEAPPDSDSDGLNDNIDNCPDIANEDQADFDSDGEGDACDSDDDDDGTNDDDDAFPYDDTESLDTDGDGIGNNEDYDDDADGILDSFDNAPLVVNAIVIDSDSDGVIDSVDAYPNDPTKQYLGSGDLDGDGYSNDEEVDYCSNPFDKASQPDVGGLSLPLIQVLTEQ